MTSVIGGIPSMANLITYPVEYLTGKRWESFIISQRKEETEHWVFHVNCQSLSSHNFSSSIHSSQWFMVASLKLGDFILGCHWLEKTLQLCKKLPLIAWNIITTLVPSHGNLLCKWKLADCRKAAAQKKLQNYFRPFLREQCYPKQHCSWCQPRISKKFSRLNGRKQ